jgi:hypothetical protein
MNSPITLYDQVVLERAIPQLALECGAVGSVVHVHPNAAVYEVEFLRSDGSTAGVETVLASDLRPL